MIKVKKIGLFLPFFFIGILFLIEAALTFYKTTNQTIWLGMEIGISILFLWIFVLIRRKSKNG
jgi:uncharacterized membrane protein